MHGRVRTGDSGLCDSVALGTRRRIEWSRVTAAIRFGHNLHEAPGEGGALRERLSGYVFTRSGTQSDVLPVEPTANELGRMRFRLAPDHVAGIAAEVNGHRGADNGLHLAPVARAADGIRESIGSTPVDNRGRRVGHVGLQRSSCASAPLECYREYP
jgi:hypothetical protein